jgi:hypothetical protein
MKSAEDLAHEIIPHPAHIAIQGDPSWLREDIADVLRPLLAVLERAVYEQRYGCTSRCRICGRTWWRADEPAHADDCPVPAALEVV